MEIKTNQPTNYERLLIKKEMERQELQVRNHNLQVRNHYLQALTSAERLLRASEWIRKENDCWKLRKHDQHSFHLRVPPKESEDRRPTIYVSAPWKAANDEPYLPI